MKVQNNSFSEYCLKNGIENILSQWHPTKNGDLRPETVPFGTHRKVWWQCDKGHEWQAEVKSRAVGKGCPYCTNRKILVGFNDLATTHPDLAAQWHPTKNGESLLQKVTFGTHRKVWWQCDKGHEWQAFIPSRSNCGNGCPACTGKMIIPGENDLASNFPDLAAQWHPTKNVGRTPEGVSAYSNHRVWWQCDKGHEWRAPVGDRSYKGVGCPYCSNRRVLAGFNDLATLEPRVAAQWHTELNGPLTPEMVTPGSHRRVWWRCGEGHVWKAVIYSRTGEKKCGCPVCAGNVRRRYIRD